MSCSEHDAPCPAGGQDDAVEHPALARHLRALAEEMQGLDVHDLALVHDVIGAVARGLLDRSDVDQLLADGSPADVAAEARRRVAAHGAHQSAWHAFERPGQVVP